MGAVNLTYTCDAPGCKSYHTVHPSDAHDPAKSLRSFGWKVVTLPDDEDSTKPPRVRLCYCILHRDLFREPEPIDAVPSTG